MSPRQDSSAPAVGLGRRRLLAGSGIVAMSGLLAACGAEQAPPAVPKGPTAPATATPVATAERFSAVVKEVSDSVVAADQARDPAQLAPRVVGSAVEFRTRSYEIMAKDAEVIASLPTPAPTVVLPVVPTDGDFPRTAIAIVPDAADASRQYFMPLQQADARAPYTTWGWALQHGGVEMPSVAPAESGSGAVAPDADDLLMTPADALALYAGVLSNGDAADPEDRIAPDPFQQVMHGAIQEERAKLNAGVPADSLAVIHEEYTVLPDELAALRTADDGAIVIGSLRSSRRIDVVPGATVSGQEPEFRLAGRSTFSKEFVRDYGETIALYIPPADAGAKIQPIGATKLLLGAHGE